jgi:hypothetical protein
MEEGVYYDVHVIIFLDVIQADVTWNIMLMIKIVGWFGQFIGRIKSGDGSWLEPRCQNAGDIFQGWIGDGITIR